MLESGESRTEVLIARGESHGAKPGDIVNVEVLEYPSKRSHAIGRVIEIVGRKDQSGIDTDVAILAHGIPNEWPAEALAEARSWSAEVPEKAKEGREDLRSVPLVTIDGADAKDFDDAVYCEPQGDGWRLLVAIADVSHYVRPDSPLDREARGRGTSVYFPDRVVPMLPEELSNGLCSLNPHVDRLCLVCEMQVSRARRGDALALLRCRDALGGAPHVHGSCRHARRGSAARAARRAEAGAAALERRLRSVRGACASSAAPSTSTCRRRRSSSTSAARCNSVRAVERLVTHKIIEECMIAANVEAAKRIHKGKHPGPVPRPRRARTKASSKSSCCSCARSATSSTPSKISPKEINRILASVSGKPEEELVETVVLRSMMQARYQPGNVGHFGLALGAYAHFTSPIRRYPDLLVHRAIKWLNDKRSAKGFRYALPEMEQLGEHCSRTERRADEATREVAERLKCVYLKERVGETFDVVISSVVAVRAVRALGGDSGRRPRARHGVAARLLPQGPDRDDAEGRALGPRVPAHRDDQGAARRRQRRRTQDRLRSRRERRARPPSRVAARRGRG